MLWLKVNWPLSKERIQSTATHSTTHTHTHNHTRVGYLHRGHVIESMVQLLANSLVLQFLGIELVCKFTKHWGQEGNVEVGQTRDGRLGGGGGGSWLTADLSRPEISSVRGRKPHERDREDVPSRSSMVFSSLATDLSANSARVSACGLRGQVRS